MIIGLHGAKGSGKDQFYRAIKAEYPDLNIRKIAYADPIKNEVSRIFELQTEEQYDAFKRSRVFYTLPRMLTHHVEGRQIVREIGMKMRSYDPTQFVRYVEEEIAKDPTAVWCITDLRFDNELESIRKMNGLVVKIKRAGFEFDGHVTEIEFPNLACDIVIHNDRLTLEEYNKLAVLEFDYLRKEKA